MPDVPVRAAALPRSGIRAVMDLAWAAPGPVLRLEVGQPDVAPPEHVLSAMNDAIARKETGYTPNAGIAPLRAACSEKLARVNGITCPPDRILVTAGSMQGIAASVLGLVEPGDEVLVPDPGWPNYAMVCRLASVRAVGYPLRRERDYLPDLAEIAPLVSERTRMIVLNSPSNPLGTVWDRESMQGWLDLAERHDVWLLSDECYDEIAFDVAPVSPASLPGGAERVVAVHSFSKTYAMTGLRVGYVSGPATVMATLTKMQEALVACVNGPAQHGAVAALTGPQDFVEEMRATYRQRRDLAVAVAAEAGIPHLVPQGAFYLWLPLGDQIGDTLAFCRRLIDEQHVAVAPGETFGSQGAHAVRVSLATDEATIKEGLGRLASVL